MNAGATSPRAADPRRIGSWIIRVVVSVMFLGAGAFKLSGSPVVIDEFNQVGLGQWFRIFTAALEITGAGLLLWPRTVATGAIVLTVICIGAFVAQIAVLHGDVIHTLVLAVILVAIAWTHRSQISGSYR